MTKVFYQKEHSYGVIFFTESPIFKRFNEFTCKKLFPLTGQCCFFIIAYGRLITVGSNKFGQLGLGDFKPRAGPCVVKGEMVGKRVVHAACGDDFTVVATTGIYA